MEWFVLFVAVPLILVPVVLLWGFSGCSFPPGIVPWMAPKNLSATGISTNEIVLTWDPQLESDGTVASVTYEIELGNGNVYAPLQTQSGTTYHHLPLDQGTAYYYRVRVIGDAVGSTSPWAEAQGRTRAVAFEKALTTDNSGLQGRCLVQRFNQLAYPGTKLWITLRSADSGPLILDAIFISRPTDSPPGDPYDSAVDLTEVASNVVIFPGKPVEVAVAYTVDPARPMLLAFNVNADNAWAYIRVATAPQTEGILYQNNGPHEAAIADRLPSATNPTGTPYSSANVIAIVEKIVVGYD